MPARRRSAKTVATPAKYSETEIKTVTETPQPEKTLPPSPNLTWNDYKEDFKVRLEIHNYEMNALMVDVKKAYEFASPYIKQATNDTVKAYTLIRERLDEPVGVTTTD